MTCYQRLKYLGSCLVGTSIGILIKFIQLWYTNSN